MIFHFKFLQANLSDGKEGTFTDDPGRQLASLPHWLWVVSYEQIYFETRGNPSHLFLIRVQFSLNVQCRVFVVANKEYENIYAQRSKYSCYIHWRVTSEICLRIHQEFFLWYQSYYCLNGSSKHMQTDNST